MKHHHSLRPGSAFAVPPISRWRKDLWGPGTYIYDSRKHDQRFEVFRGDSPRGTYAGRGYTPGKWFARTFFYGLVPYTLARRENSEWGGTYDFEHEAWPFDSAEAAIQAMREWWGDMGAKRRVLHGDYVKTNTYGRTGGVQ